MIRYEEAVAEIRFSIALCYRHSLFISHLIIERSLSFLGSFFGLVGRRTGFVPDLQALLRVGFDAVDIHWTILSRGGRSVQFTLSLDRGSLAF